MKLEPALEEFGLLQRRRHRGEEGRRVTVALAALREFLLDYSGFHETDEVTPQDLLSFILEYYPCQEDPEADVALALLEAAGGFARWLMERGERGLARFSASEERLRLDVPRVLEALHLLKEYARREDLPPPVALTDEDGEAEVGAIGSGLQRVARLDEVDYAAAEEEYYTVRRIDAASLALGSWTRDALGEGAIEPVDVPPRAAVLLKPGDIIHTEVAPGPAGWEMLEVFGIRPGGYA